MAKFTVTFKDPDYSTDGDRDTLLAESTVALKATFLKWGEYVTLEFDTETKSARVVPVKEFTS